MKRSISAKRKKRRWTGSSRSSWEKLGDHPALTVTYFVPDARKCGGVYLTKIGNLKKIDEYERWMMLTDGTKIPLDDVADIESELFRDMF